MITSEKVPLVYAISLSLYIRAFYTHFPSLTRVYILLGVSHYRSTHQQPPRSKYGRSRAVQLFQVTRLQYVRLLRNGDYIGLFCVIHHRSFIATKTAVRFSPCDAFLSIRPFLFL